jgi:hypothetical protein
MKRMLGFIIGALFTYQEQYIFKAYAVGYTNADPIDRIDAVMCGLVLLVIIMEIIRRVFSQGFFNGFIMATGLFLSFDIVVFHWVFKLENCVVRLRPIIILESNFRARDVTE